MGGSLHLTILVNRDFILISPILPWKRSYSVRQAHCGYQIELVASFKNWPLFSEQFNGCHPDVHLLPPSVYLVQLCPVVLWKFRIHVSTVCHLAALLLFTSLQMNHKRKPECFTLLSLPQGICNCPSTSTLCHTAHLSGIHGIYWHWQGYLGWWVHLITCWMLVQNHM